jgi:hypothetical protein
MRIVLYHLVAVIGLASTIYAQGPTKAEKAANKDALHKANGVQLQDAYKSSLENGDPTGEVPVDGTSVSVPTTDLSKELKKRGIARSTFALDLDTEDNLARVSNDDLVAGYEAAVKAGHFGVVLPDPDIPNGKFTVSIDDAKLEMRKRGIFDLFGAVFNSAFALAATGNGTVRSAQDAIEPQFRGTIDWESEHFGGDTAKAQFFHFSFGGTFGYAPVMLMTDLQKNGTAEPGAPRPLFQQGLVWDITPRINSKIPGYDQGEFSSFFRFGENWYTSEVSSFKAQDDTIVATVISNDVGRAASFWEVGEEFRLFKKTLPIVHAEKSFVTPVFSVSGGFRHDGRFNRSGELATYDSPESRTFVRFLVTLTKLLLPETPGQPTRTFDASFGVDYQRPLADSRIPAATRIIFKSDIDLIKLLQTGKTKDDPAKNPPSN